MGWSPHTLRTARLDDLAHALQGFAAWRGLKGAVSPPSHSFLQQMMQRNPDA